MYPAVDDIVRVSNAAIKMFGSLKDEEGGVVSGINSNMYLNSNVLNMFSFLQKNLFYIDPRSGAKSGSLYNAILYRRRQQGDADRSTLNASLVEITEEQKDQVKNYLKTCRLPSYKDAFQVILAQYKDFRRDLIGNSFDEYKSIWNFYFVCPDLVRK